ncbi:MAG: DUF2586 family protein [Polyangiales bacterium]
MLASVSSTITDRGLGLPQGQSEPMAVCGCSSSGTVDSPTLVRTADQLTTTFGQGPAVELAAYLLALAGGPIVFCRATTASAGSAGSVTRTGTGLDADAWALTVSGTPRDAYKVRVKVTRYGATLAALTAAVRVSIDGGQTYGPEVPVPGSGALTLGNTGLTVTFDDDSGADEALADDVYAFDCTAPTWDATGLGTALAALAGAGPTLAHDGVVVVGHVTGVTVATVKTSHDALIAASRPRWFLCHARDQNSGESIATWVGVLVGGSPGFAAHTANLMAVAAGYADVDSQAIGGIWRRSVAWPIAARLAATPPQRHPGRVRSGPLAGVRPGGLYHDLSAASMQVLDTRRFIGAQTLQGVDGYVATDRTTAPDGSDFTSIMRVRVMVYAARLAMQRMTQEVNEERLINEDGTINAAEADAIDAAVTSFMRGELANAGANRRYVSEVSVAVSRTTNLITSPTLPFRLRIRPLYYSTTISLDLGYALSVRS